MGTIVNDEYLEELERIWKLWKDGKLQYRRPRSAWLEVDDLLGSKVHKQHLWLCSSCRWIQTLKTIYCPHCGAEMEEENA